MTSSRPTTEQIEGDEMAITDEGPARVRMAEESLDAAQVLARARAVAPVLRERAAEIERARRLPPEVVELLRSTGVFRMCFSRDWGGPELTSIQQLEVVEALAYGDASAAWCAAIGACGGLYSNFLEPAVARAMFPTLDTIVAGALQPGGRAERVPGGYRVSGRWSFGSGITHSDWVMSGAFVYQDGQPYASPDGSNPHESRQFLVPADQARVIDGWDTTGLCGTGSCDYTLSDVFVPEQHALTFDIVKGRPSPLTQPESFMRTLCGVPLGVTRAALDQAREWALKRTDRMTGTAWADSYRVQTTLAECEAQYNAARAGVHHALTRQWEVLAAGGTLDDLTPAERAASPLSWVHAFRTARSVVHRLYDLHQAWSINRSSPFDRWLRDTTTMCQHLIAHDRILQSAGAHLLGSKPEFGICLGIIG